MGVRTTIAIDEELVDELMRLEPGVSRSAAMRRAVEAHVRQKRLEGFMTLAGSGLVDVNWRETERQELRKLKRHGRSR
ncbi:MAG: ribbon-helix-helix protein, CopG family [Acidobacteria bacterium]|nr:ribbon-helix-helix protein, CopG family [Acidobacteriota bacterium]